MNKREMTEALAKKCQISDAKAVEVMNAFFDTRPGQGIIAIELEAGRKVQLPGFGTFFTKRREARTGRNPATGEEISIEAKTYPGFKPGKGLKDRVAE